MQRKVNLNCNILRVNKETIRVFISLALFVSVYLVYLCLRMCVCLHNLELKLIALFALSIRNSTLTNETTQTVLHLPQPKPKKEEKSADPKTQRAKPESQKSTRDGEKFAVWQQQKTQRILSGEKRQ